jgi:hypothetical protein
MALAMTGYFDKGKRTRREQFLAEMDQVVPWARLAASIEPHYPKGSLAGGRPQLPLPRILRIYCLQHWYNLSDPGAEEALYDSLATRRFTGISTDADVISDETSILNFRRLLEQHQLTAQLFAEINPHLAERGLLIGRGTIVDATIINAPPSTKNAKKERTPQMHQTRKGRQWYFGMKVHTGTDTDSALVDMLQATCGERGRRERARRVAARGRGEPAWQLGLPFPGTASAGRGRRDHPQRRPARDEASAADPGAACPQPAPFAEARRRRASVPGGQAVVGSCQSALPRDREILGADVHAV